jgi:hypothetical protein
MRSLDGEPAAMKINLSFIGHPGRWVPAAAAVLFGLSAALLVVSIWLVTYANSVRNELPALRERFAKVESQPRPPVKTNGSAATLPPDDTLKSLRRRVAGVNTLLDHRGQPLFHQLVLLEQLLPANARLVSLSLQSETGTLTLVAESEQHEALAQFLQNLEGSGRFEEVLLIRQTQRSERSSALRQFEYRLKEWS